MRKIMLASVILCILSACAGIRQDTIDLSLQDLENIETSKQIAVNLLKAWPFKSGFIRGAMGSKLDELPAQAIDAMNEMDRLAMEVDSLSDQDLGLSLGLQVRMLQQTVQVALEMFAPDVLKALTKVGMTL